MIPTYLRRHFPVARIESMQDRSAGEVMPGRVEMIRSSMAAAVLAVLGCQAHAVEAGADIAAFVKQINAVVAPVKPGDRKAIRAACNNLVEQAFDVAAMAPDISDGAWKRMNKEQRQAYVRGLSRRAASDCASHGSEVAGNTVELIGVRQGESGDRLVAVKQSKGRGRTVIWRVRAGSGGALKAVDMTVDGRSLAASARRDAKNVLKKTDGNVIALIRSVGG
jgi:ABC-type transporter MlaC component